MYNETALITDVCLSPGTDYDDKQALLAQLQTEKQQPGEQQTGQQQLGSDQQGQSTIASNGKTSLD
jgi:hypothetical protein